MINIVDMIKKATKKKVVTVDLESPVVEPIVETLSLAIFSVYDSNGGFVRSYNTDLHGKDAGKLANQFAIKINGQVK